MSVTQPQIILAATTAGGTSSEFDVGPYADITVSISGASAALANAETVTIQYKDATGTWRAEVDAIQGAAQITAGETSVTLKKNGRARAVLTATSALTGLEISDCNR